MRRLFPAIAISAALALIACDRPPSADGLKEWTPVDHEGEKKQAGPKQGPRGGGGGTPVDMAELTWRQQCSACHGLAGHGDGPQGPMFKPPDLSNAEWQAKVEDAQIAATITNGKGRMPKFDLPEDVVRGLVARVRSLRAR